MEPLSYVGYIGEGHVVDAFADLLRGAEGSLGQSLRAHFLKHTLRSLKGHQEVSLQLSPAEKTNGSVSKLAEVTTNVS